MLTLKHIYPFAVICFLFMHLSMHAGGIEKAYDSLKEKDFYGAKKQFERLLYKEPIGANFGLSSLHYERNNPFYDIDASLTHCNRADSLFEFVLQREYDRMAALGINRASIQDFKQKIALRALEDVKKDFTEQRLHDYLDRFKFANCYNSAVEIRDSLAFKKADMEGSYLAYRQFITEFPGAKQRAIADSLYALRFFEEKTITGGLADYRLFVKEFPANPYTDMAYDSIFFHTRKIDTREAYQGYLVDFEENKNTETAWRLLTLINLRDYSEASLVDLIRFLPANPYLPMLKQELELMYVKRFVMAVDSSFRLVDNIGRAIGPLFDDIAEFHEGLARVISKGKIGYVDKTGTVVVQPIYSDGYNYSDGLVVVEKGGKFGAIDRFGSTVIPFIYDELGNMKNGLIAFEKNEVSGFLDWNGKKAFAKEFEYAADFEGNYAVVRVDGLYGAINRRGDYSIPPEYDWVEGNRDGFSRVRRGELFGLYKHRSGLHMAIEYSAIGPIHNGLRIVAKDQLFGYVNADGEVVIPFQYDFTERVMEKSKFVGNHAAVPLKGKWGLIDRSGAFKVKPNYQDLLNTGYSILPFEKNGRWSYVDTSGVEFPRTFEFVEPFAQGVAVVKDKGLAGLMDLSRQLLIRMEYQSLKAIKDTELVIFETDTGKGVMTRNGAIVLDAIYDDIRPLNIRFIMLTLHGSEQLYDHIDQKVVWEK